MAHFLFITGAACT